MIVLVVLLVFQAVMIQSSQKAEIPQAKSEGGSTAQNLKRIQDLLAEKLQSLRSNPRTDSQPVRVNNGDEIKSSGRKSKSLAFYPFLLSQMVPFGPPSGYYYPQNKEVDNSYSNEWLSRTEPFKRNTALLDSPTYYIRLPPNPYAFVPGLGYISRPPSLSDPEVFETDKPESQPESGNDIFNDPFYRLPINFVSNGKPTSVYQLSNEPALTKPESNMINLNKGPYVFNGKPSEIFLVAQIYNALYGDELNHFYP